MRKDFFERHFCPFDDRPWGETMLGSLLPLYRTVWPVVVVVLVSASTGKASESDQPGYRHFWTDTIYMQGHSAPSKPSSPYSGWTVPRQQRFFAATGTKPLDVLLQDDACQAVVRVFYDPTIAWWTVLATVRFTSDGLHVRTAWFDWPNRSRDVRTTIGSGKDWEKYAVVEEKRFSRETRNYLALALNRIRVGRLASVAPDLSGPGFGGNRMSIPVLWPRPRERHVGGSEWSVEWQVEAKAKGREPFSNAFVVKSPGFLADVRYRNVIVCVGRVCEPLARMARASGTTRPSHGPLVPEETAGDEAEPTKADEPTRSGQPVAPTAPEARFDGGPLESRETPKRTGFAWLPFLLGGAGGLALGAAGGWVLLRHRAALTGLRDRDNE